MKEKSYRKVRVGLRRYRIPIDPDGTVPNWALAQRFQEVGSTEDIDSDAPIILPAGCTPKELRRWWRNPGCCDIEGIDTKDPPIYDVSGVPQSKRGSQRRIAVVDTTPAEQKHYREILSESFSAKELDRMSANGSFIIRQISDGGDATGCYYRRQNGVEIPLMIIERGTSPDGVVHEAVHHLRASDPTRSGIMADSYPTDRCGRLRRSFNLMPAREKDKILADEERQTVAETVARTKRDPNQSGYYDGVKGKSPRQAYLGDRQTLTGGKALKGKAVTNAIEKNYRKTSISRADITGRRGK